MTRLISIVLVAGSAGVAMADAPSLTGSLGSAANSFGGRSVLIDQTDGAGRGRASQVFESSNNAFFAFAFDDMTFGSAVDLTSLTVFGQNGAAGGEAFNVAVRYAILTTPDAVSGVVVASGLGTQTGGTLSFDLTGVSLGAGTYWLTAYVERPFAGGGQWFWNESSDPVSGSESFWHNPLGGFGAGTSPVPGIAVFGNSADLAFRLEGDVVPAPGALALLGLGGLVAGRRRR
jgi:MYXO-CTERM domain-containing protein